MIDDAPPNRCLLCNAARKLVSAGFRQEYPQKDSGPMFLDWWECRSCRGWFVFPLPSPDVIERHWGAMDYNDETNAIELTRAKRKLLETILRKLSKLTPPGPLLDFGCNFGDFLVMAAASGWKPYGFEPCREAAERGKARGFDVRVGWTLDEASFGPGKFNAVTAIDSFCFTWSPVETLATFHRFLKPGGVLAMRLTNKRFMLGLARLFSRPGPSRDARISKILKTQFHSIGMAEFKRILEDVGFESIEVQPRALTAPWKAFSREAQLAYLGASILYYSSLGNINISPGVLLFARKPTSEATHTATCRADNT